MKEQAGIPNEAARRLHDESLLAQFTPEELNTRLITYEDALLEYDEDDRPTLEIISDTVVEVDGVQIKLTPTKVFILNALRLSQGFPQTRAEMMDLGFRGTNSPFINGINSLAVALEAAGQTPFIEQQKTHKKPSFYMLLPEVRIVDRRSQQDPWQVFVQESVHLNEDGTVRMCEDSTIDFLSTQRRILATTAMFRDFSQKIDIDYELARLLHNRTGRRSERVSTLPVAHIEKLQPEQESALLYKKELALAAYLSGRQYSEDQEATIVEGIGACVELLAHNLDLPYIFSRRYWKSQVPLAELSQEAAAQLVKAILEVNFSTASEHAFRTMAISRILGNHQYGIRPLIDSYFMPVSAPINLWQELRDLVAQRERLTEMHGTPPDIATLSKALGIRAGKTLGLLALTSESVSLDAEIEDGNELTLASTLREESFVDDELDRMERQDALDELFGGNYLSDIEKVALSVHYKLYHPSLRGAVIDGQNTTFTYPHTEEDFNTFAENHTTIRSLAKALGMNETALANCHKRGLLACRQVLIENPVFDEYGHVDTPEARAMQERERQERQELISLALELSPKKRLGTTKIDALYRAGDFTVTSKTIISTFGSIEDFHEACGFTPKPSLGHKKITNEELVSLALELRPDGPLSHTDILELSRRGSFVSIHTVKKRFGSLPAFHKQCGFSD